MLQRLTIQNLATLQKGVLEPGAGFTVLTGETGAGKSVILKALRLILGAKASKDLVRAGAKELVVEAEFALEGGHPAWKLLEEFGLLSESELIIRRKVTAEGKSTVLINGFSAAVGQLEQLGELLFDLQGQNAQSELSQNANHQAYLDDFAGLGPQVTAFGEALQQARSIQRELAELQGQSQSQAQRADFLRFQVQEIQKSKPSLEEETALIEEVQLLGQSEKLLQELAPIAAWVEGEHSPLDRMTQDCYNLARFAEFSPALAEAKAEIDSGLIQLAEAARQVAGFLSRLETNPERLDQAQERLSEFDKLKRKYGPGLAEVLAHAQAAQLELSRLENLDEEIETLTRKALQSLQQAQQLAEKISAGRASHKPRFEAHIMGILEKLGMEKCKFEARLEPCELSTNGLERVVFWIAANPGQPLLPLSKIASGGEISRIMLALKSALNHQGLGVSLFFDEVDQGISGRVSQKVGEMLQELSKNAQVLVITHSPQVAALADCHVLVEKKLTEHETTTLIQTLSEEQRVEEIAKFLGGDTLTENALARAREMREQAWN